MRIALSLSLSLALVIGPMAAQVEAAAGQGAAATGSKASAGASGSLKCEKPVAVDRSSRRVQCYFADRLPYVPLGMTVAASADTTSPGRYPVTFQVPRKLRGGEGLKLELLLHDDAGIGGSGSCEGSASPAAGYLQIRNCAGGYPARNNYRVGAVSPKGWWGPFGGQLSPEAASNADGARLAKSITQISRFFKKSVDLRAGIRLSGEGFGGTGAILQSMALPNAWWQKSISIVDSQLPHTLFVEDILPGDASARLAWGDFDTGVLDFRRMAAAGKVSHIYYRINGSSSDEQGRVNPDFFRICEQYRVACFGTWHSGGHSRSETGIRLPGGLFTDPKQDVRLDQVLPVFTGSTANHWGERGHYNLGLGWDSTKIFRSDKAIIVPLRYQRHTGLTESPAAKPLPDQPGQATFSVTLRRIGALGKRKGEKMNWVLVGTGQKGRTVVAPDGSITIENITLPSSEAYTKLWVTPEPPVWKLVYTRQPRATKPVPGTPIQEAANWQHATDVGRINGGLAEADVVIDDLKGRVKVIHDCTNSKEVCVAHEARVSPDGTKIAYSVGYGNTLLEVESQGIKMGIWEVPGLTHARLWIHDLATGKSAPIPHHPDRAIDRQPEWLNNDKIVFASNRGNTYPFKNQFSTHRGLDQFGRGRCFNEPYCVSQEYGYGLEGRSMQIWTMNIDGTGARNISPHENNALAPAVMSNGDILYSCWNAHESLSFDAQGRNSNNPGTAKNKWWLCRTDGNGADQTVILNGHKTLTLKTKEWLAGGVDGGEGRSELRAIRSVAEVLDGKLAVSNYYRSNHVGSMGIIYGMDYGDPHVEGCSTARCYPDSVTKSNRPGSGQYVPSSLYAITPYGTDQDIDVRRDAQNRPMGKAGYAAPLPDTDSQFLITHARGSCYEVTLPQQATRAAMTGEPTCQKAIYRVKVPVVTNPFDKRQMEFMAGGEKWQAYDARAIATYQSLHGKPLPDQPEPLNPEAGCYLQVVDARQAELAPAKPYNWFTNLYAQCALQGCAVNTEDPKFHARNMDSLTILLAQMWDMSYRGGNEETYAASSNNMGHKSIAILGSQPMEEDGSIKMRVPCETPFIMTGTDADGMSIAHDSMLHSLRRGETRTCHGCHDGHSEERAAKLGQPALERFRETQSNGSNRPPLQPLAPITFAQVQPILEKRCTGCHKDMTNADGLLYYRVAQDYEQHDWPWAKKQPGQGQRTSVEHVLIRRAGRGYKVGEPLLFKPGGARGKVAAVGPRGNIQKIQLIAGGEGYKPLTKVPVNSASGKGAALVAMTDRFDLFRPYTSKWVARFARNSLLYWKCIGSRQDGRTDAQYNNDIDFGKAHNSGATREECLTIGRWIDTGVQL